jgi:hypothetical protein
MKKIIVLAVSVLFCTQVFANGTEDPSKVVSSVGVMNSNGSSLFRVMYKAPSYNNIKVSIINDRQEVVFTETLRKMNGFMRPYNFDGLPLGAYTIQIEDSFGKQIEKVNYGLAKSETLIHLAKLSGEDTKYILTGLSTTEDEIQVRIYDSLHQLLYEESRKVVGQFGEIYNLRNLPGPFTVEVSDSRGILKTIRY